MLVLSRQRDETIMIGDDIEITIVDIRGDKVRVGINAPRKIQVHRKEVYDAIKAEELTQTAQTRVVSKEKVEHLKESIRSSIRDLDEDLRVVIRKAGS